MKLKQLSLAVVAATAIFFSCNDAKKTDDTTLTTTDTLTTTEPAAITTVSQQAASEGTAVLVTADNIPGPIKTTFVTKYPKAQKTEWYSYQPVADDNLSMDDQYYYVRYNDNGADYISWYNNRGEWVKTSTKVPGNKNLPDAVNKYINANYPGYTIEEINKENDKDMDMFEIKLNKGEEKAKIKILPDGTIFKKK